MCPVFVRKLPVSRVNAFITCYLICNLFVINQDNSREKRIQNFRSTDGSKKRCVNLHGKTFHATADID